MEIYFPHRSRAIAVNINIPGRDCIEDRIALDGGAKHTLPTHQLLTVRRRPLQRTGRNLHAFIVTSVQSFWLRHSFR